MATCDNACNNVPSSLDECSNDNDHSHCLIEKKISTEDAVALCFENLTDCKSASGSSIFDCPQQDCRNNTSELHGNLQTMDCNNKKDEEVHLSEFNLSKDAVSKVEINPIEYNIDCQSTHPVHDELNDIVELISCQYKSENGEVDAADSNNTTLEEHSLSSLQPLAEIEVDENTTQLQLNHLCKMEEGSLSLQPNEVDQILAKTTLSSLPSKENTSESFREISYLLSAGSDRESDQESNSSCNDELSNDIAASSCFVSPEESSLDSGIASVDDSDPTLNSKPANKTNEFSAADDLPPNSIPGKKRHLIDAPTSPKQCKSQKLNCGKPKVTFDGVTVYYFPRKQSFVTVPSQGGSTLGMGLKHSHSKHLSLSQHKRLIARNRRRTIEELKQQQQINARIKQLREDFPNMEMPDLLAAVTAGEQNNYAKNAEEEIDLGDDDDDDFDDDVSSEDEFDDDNYYLQPIPAKKRRILLRMAGVQKIDVEEYNSNKSTRASREVCGCSCVKICLPSSCQCALAGIPCQVDRESFPCGCVPAGCRNMNGRVEFDASRVKRHYFETMRKIRLQETGALDRDEIVELPQPAKSPYASDRFDQFPSSSTEDVNEMLSIQHFPPSSVDPHQPSFDDHSTTTVNAPLSVCSTQLDTWSFSFNTDATTSSMPLYSLDIPADHRIDTDGVIGSLESVVNGSSAYFDSLPLSNDPASALFPDVTSGRSTSGDVMLPQASSFQSPPSDSTLFESIDAKITSTHELGYRQTCKLDPIASFFPSNGRRPSDELPNSPQEEPVAQSPIKATSSASSCTQTCSIASLLCADDADPSSSRSSSLSECSHDSVVKA